MHESADSCLWLVATAQTLLGYESDSVCVPCRFKLRLLYLLNLFLMYAMLESAISLTQCHHKRTDPTMTTCFRFVLGRLLKGVSGRSGPLDARCHDSVGFVALYWSPSTSSSINTKYSYIGWLALNRKRCANLDNIHLIIDTPWSLLGSETQDSLFLALIVFALLFLVPIPHIPNLLKNQVSISSALLERFPLFPQSLLFPSFFLVSHP